MTQSAKTTSPQATKILVVDASNMSRKALTKLLAKDNTVFSADSSETAWQLLDEQRPQCVVVDMEHQRDDALALLELIRNANNSWLRRLPVLMIGPGDARIQTLAIETGASAYIGKPFESGELLALIDNPPKASENATRPIAAPGSIDSITSLPKADYFHYRGEKELAFAKRYNKDFAVVLFEVDSLERLVSEFGAPLAKQIIKKLGKYLTEAIRGEDTAARLSGRRFGVIAPTCNEFGAKSIADRVLESVRKRVFQYGEHRVSFTVSAGLAAPRLSQCNEFADVVTTARKRLASAIAAGGNQAVFDGRSLENALSQTQQHHAVDDLVTEAEETEVHTVIRPAVQEVDVEDILEDAPSLDVVMWLLEHGLGDELKPHYGKLLDQITPLLENAGAAMGPELQTLVDKLQARRRDER
ncbi:MAG: diguanylate cyclase [Gammaproteobacteria bacterium]|nr:diguanylate cyclase [Gammaproteobacteria bacterium]